MIDGRFRAHHHNQMASRTNGAMGSASHPASQSPHFVGIKSKRSISHGPKWLGATGSSAPARGLVQRGCSHHHDMSAMTPAMATPINPWPATRPDAVNTPTSWSVFFLRLR